MWSKKMVLIFCGTILLAGGLALAREIHVAHPHHSEKSTQPLGKYQYFHYDTLLWFGAEDSLNNDSWNDLVTGEPWVTVDRTAPWADTLWHVDTLNVCAGDSAWWWGNPDIGPNGGYDDDRWGALISPSIILTADQDSVFLIYDHWVRCEESHDWPYQNGWDGYNVRIALSADPDSFFEIKPYHIEYDSSYYKTPANITKEWVNLRCWEHHGEPPMGGFAQDTSTHCTTKIFDFRPYAGDTIQIAFVFASDWAYATPEDSTLFGLVLDNILVVEGMDSLTLATLPEELGGDTLFYDGLEFYPHQAWDYKTKDPTGDWWWLADGDAHSGLYKAMCSDSITGEFVPDLDNFILSPKIAHDDLPEDMIELDLMWYLKGDMAGQGDECHAFNQYKLDEGPWENISVLHGSPCGTYCYSLEGISDTAWWSVDMFYDFLHDMTPLVTDTTILWDTLQVAIGVRSGASIDTTGTIGLQVDDVTLSGRRGAPYDLGVTAAQIPSPNANDVKLWMDSVAVYNYGFNTATTGSYTISMEIQDSTGTAVFGPSVVGMAGPNVDPFDYALVPLDTSVAKFTFTEEGVYDFYVWTNWPADTTTWNDTLRTEYTAKAYYYPNVYNYPAGQGELRYHDQGFYSYPDINLRSMTYGEKAAVHFTPDPKFYPFGLVRALPKMKEVGQTYNLTVLGSGEDPQLAPTLCTVQFSTPSTDSVRFQQIDLHDSTACQNLNSDFWLMVDFPTGTGGDSVMAYEGGDPDVFGDWQHSYLCTVDVPNGCYWTEFEDDWMITAVISFRTVFAEAMPSLSGPPKNSSGNLYLDWPDVSQAAYYLIFRETEPYPPDDLGSYYRITLVSEYTDTNAVGNTTTNYYYWFRTVHKDLSPYDKLSQGVGEFDRSLINVGP